MNLRRMTHSNVTAACIDGMVALISFPAAMWMRLGEKAWQLSYLNTASLAFAALLLSIFLVRRTYRRVWRYTSLSDLVNLANIVGVALLVFYIGMFAATRLIDFPRSVIIIHWLLTMAMLAFVRLCARLYTDRDLLKNPSLLQKNRASIVLIGASAQAETFIRESQRSGSFPYQVAAIIDDDPRKLGREIRHVRIYGPITDIAFLIEKLRRRSIDISRLVLCDTSLPKASMDALVQTSSEYKIALARLPQLSELREGEARYSIKPVMVEDILGRPQVTLDIDAMRALVHGKRVLVTGAGGSIGSELVRQIANYSPSLLVLYEISEFQLYEIEQEMVENFPDVPREAVVGDVRDCDHLSRQMRTHAPDIVFHAAAIKHVPMAERNVGQAVLTNVLGSRNIVDVCARNGVATLVQISTDKAVNPTSIMGASKRIAEIYAQAFAQQAASTTRIITVRFGNVLGSNGSVVPLFQRQIAKGGPVTVTHPDMTRYVMSIREAVQLVMQAAALGVRAPEESAPIFVLEMGKPIKILELAEQMIRLAGRKLYEEIDIVFTGIRPGEKMFEELFHDQENLLPTAHHSIRKARSREYHFEAIARDISALIDLARRDDEAALRASIAAIVPEYVPFQNQLADDAPGNDTPKESSAA